jgi:hypothetical protein
VSTEKLEHESQDTKARISDWENRHSMDDQNREDQNMRANHNITNQQNFNEVTIIHSLIHHHDHNRNQRQNE